MEKEAVLQALTTPSRKFPRDAIEAAVAMREDITPDLLRILQDTVERAEDIAAGDPEGIYCGHIFSLLLLAQFRETRAYPLAVAFARLDGQLLEDLAGDFVTEDLCRVLASVCGGDTGPIEAIIEDDTVDEFARDAALNALCVLVKEGARSRDEVMAYFLSLYREKLEREPSMVWCALVAMSVDLYPEEVKGHIAGAYDDGMVDPGYINRRELEATLNRDKDAVLEDFHRRTPGFITTDTIASLAGWACFREPERMPSISRKPPLPADALPRATSAPPGHEQRKAPPKTGRNEPCPCGSGKKYKKCCLNKG